MFKIFVGNLNYRTTPDGLREIFSAHGEVLDVFIGTDRETGRSRGFGFVTMESDDLAKRAAAELNNSTLDGRNLKVNEAEERREGGGGRGGFGGGRGGGGGGGGGRGGCCGGGGGGRGGGGG
ncbi:MAG: RNA recognition motif domain-containing protein, partial [bacterium]